MLHPDFLMSIPSPFEELDPKTAEILPCFGTAEKYGGQNATAMPFIWRGLMAEG
jgi:hypothetical protein